MGGRRGVAWLVAGAVVLGACSDRSNDGPTSPEFKNNPPGGSCNFTSVSNLTKSEFGASSTESGYATDMKNAGAGTNTATYNGYLILQSLGAKYDGNADPDNPQSTTNASALSVALLGCMNVGGAAVPAASTFDAALGVYGAFGVRGLAAGDAASVFSHDQVWVLQPPETGSKTTWQAITNLSTGITDSRIAKAILVYGVRSSLTGTAFTKDQLVNPVVFDWATVPPATFSSDLGGVIVGECVSPPSFMQHLPVNAGAEVLGYVDPTCPSDLTSLDLPARSFAERVWRALSPAPVQAATLVRTANTGTGKGTLSPFGVVNPGGNNLGFTKSPSTKTNVINRPLTPAPTLANTTNGGTAFKQTFMLSYLSATSNNGTPGQICFNWAYSDANGATSFPLVQITKAGGYNLVATTAGTVVSPDGTSQPVPLLGQGHGAISTAFQLKNGPARTAACPSFDGTFYYPDIVGQPTNTSQVFPPFEYP
jgi:hypothetical protein